MARRDNYRGGVAIGVALAATIALTAAGPAAAQAGVKPTDDMPATETVRFAAPPLASFSVITERPLFAPSRRPPKEAPKQAPAQATPPPEIALTGITVIGARHKAIIQFGGASRIVAVDDEIDGWRVASIEERRLTIEREGRRHSVDLVRETSQAAEQGRTKTAADETSSPPWKGQRKNPRRLETRAVATEYEVDTHD